MKKMIFEVLVCMLLIGTFFVVATAKVSAAQDGDYTYIGESKAIITRYTGAGGAITIPSTLGGLATYEISDNAFYYSTSRSKVTSVIIPDSVELIGNYAFYSCTALTSVTIGNNVTAIGAWDFQSCTALTTVTIGSSVQFIGNNAFYSCSALKSVTIPDSVTSIYDYAFCYCSSLTSVTIPKSVTTIGPGAFSFCSSLTTINVDAANENYASVDGVLYNKAKTTLIQCPGGKAGTFTMPSGVTKIGEAAFCSCTSLTSVIIPSSVITIEQDAFSTCTHLTSITFLGLVAPTVLSGTSTRWIISTGTGLLGHAYAASNFPAPGKYFNGLKMGNVIGDNNELPPINNGNQTPNTLNNPTKPKTPGFEIVFVLGAVAVSILLWKKKRNI